MTKKDNRIENWDNQYETLTVTYTEKTDTPLDLAQAIGYQFIYEDIIEYLYDVKSPRILECGCGGARTSLNLALRGFDVTCSDNSPEAIRLAKTNFSAFSTHGTFLQDDLLNSQIPAESFDCVMSFGLLEHFKDLSPLVTSLTRLVRPGGIQIHLIVPKKFSTQSISNLIWFPYNFLHFAIKKKDFKNIIRKSYRDFPHYESRYLIKDYSQVFRDAGNQIIHTQPQDVLFPLIRLPLVGNSIVKHFHKQINELYRITHRTDSKILHYLSPAFNIVCRKA